MYFVELSYISLYKVRINILVHIVMCYIIVLETTEIYLLFINHEIVFINSFILTVLTALYITKNKLLLIMYTYKI